MRTLVVSLAVVGALLTARPLAAAPPQDLPAYCRSAFPQMQAQVRCLYTEKAAQERAANTRASVAPDAWARCESGSASWTQLESCLGQAGARGGATTSVGGTAAPSGGGETQPDQGADAAPSGTAAAPAAPPAEAVIPPSAVTSTPSTVILGPRGTAASAASEPHRATRPVTEAEAERHLKDVLERSGDPAARCTKKQYSGGWVTVCE